MKIAYTYQVVKEERKGNGRWTWLIQATAKNGAKSEQWIGQNKLKRLHEQGKVTGLSAVALALVGKPLEQPGNGKVYLEPRKVEPVPAAPIKSFWQTTKAEDIIEPKWNLKDFEIEQAPVATGRAYIITRADSRCCVVLPDGSLDDEWTPLMHAEIYRDSLNKGVDENKS